MKLFKKALVATAILGAMGAQAADVSDATKFTSKEGFAVNKVTSDPSVRVIVREKLEAGDKVTLQFGAGLDFSNKGADTFGVKVAQNSTIGNNEILIDYGTATFEFDYLAAESDPAKGKIVLELKTGYTIEVDESFEVKADTLVFKTTATEANATVTYSAAAWQDGSAKDTGGDNTGAFIKLAPQYSASITKKLDGVIEREAQQTFVRNGDTTKTDSFAITLTDRQDYLGALAGNAVKTKFSIAGDFTNVVAGNLTFAATGGNIDVANDIAVTKTSDSLMEVVVTDLGSDGNGGVLTVTIDNTARTSAPLNKKIVASTYTLGGEVEFNAAQTATSIISSGSDAGQWVLDATIINVPYFPVGFEGVNSQVNFANESGVAVDVLVSAIDAKGVQYSGSLADLAKYSTTKVSQVTLMAALKDSKGNTVPAGSKLSVTFNIDADEGKVNAYAFSEKVGQGRQSLVTSQQKGIK